MQRPTPPPVPPALPTRRSPAEPVDGEAAVPFVIVARRRPVRRRRGGGAIAALILTVLTGAVAVVAWPYLRPAIQRATRGAVKAKVARKTPREEVPRPTTEAVVATEPRPTEMTTQPKPVPSFAKPRESAMEIPAGGNIRPRRETDENAGHAAGEVDGLIAIVAGAIRGRDYPAAEAGIVAAVDAAGSVPELVDRVDRWRLLFDYARKLDDLVARAVSSANEGRDYTIGDRTIAVIEIGPSGYAYKEAGQIKRGPRADLPRLVERAILRTWFDGDPRPANGIFVGVHRLLDDKVDLAKVREDWQGALEGEPATAAIMPLLDDPLIAPRP